MVDPVPAARPQAAPAPALPLDLPRLVMRRASALALAVLLLALLLGLARMGDDIDAEVDAAMALAATMATLGSLHPTDDQAALAALRSSQQEAPLRHLLLQVRASDGRLLLGPPAPPADAAPLRWLLALHRELLSAPDARQVHWTVPRPSGGPWTVSLAASHESERREALGNLIGVFGMLLAGIVGLLLVMRWNVRRALRPLGRLIDAIAGIEQQDGRSVMALPRMPIRELEAVAAALRHLAGALAAAESRRRLLTQQLLTLQEDERARLARDLHDEFGQRLTAMRVDAAWLARRVADQPALRQVVDGMSQQCDRVQQDIRQLLARLQPFGPAGGDADSSESLARLVTLLQALVASWGPPGRETAATCRLQLDWLHADGSAAAWPDAVAAQALQLPRPLVLTLYRISQEALTNVARHAGAHQATLRLLCQGDAADRRLHMIWSASDDGRGWPGPTAALQRGNGIAGIQERVWAQGGELQIGPACSDPLAPGLRLEARFEVLPADARLAGDRASA